MFAVIVVVVVLVIVIGMIVLAFNGLVRRRNQVDTNWSQIAIQLKRRYWWLPSKLD